MPLDKGLPDDEIEMSLKKSKAEIIFCEETYLETIKNIMVKGETSLKHIICMDKIDRIDNIRDLIEKGEEQIEAGDRCFIDAEINLNDVA